MQQKGQSQTLRGSMRIIRALPPAPKPTYPVRVTTRQEALVAEHYVRIREHKCEKNRQVNSKNKLWTLDMEMKLIRLWNEGELLPKIAEEMGMDRKKISNKLAHLQKQERIQPRKKKLTEEQREMARILRNKGLSSREIAKKFGCSYTTVINVAKEGS